MKNVKDMIGILKNVETCAFCGSDLVYPVITPHPAFAQFEHANEENGRGIRIGCSECLATAYISAKELED